MSRAWPFLTTQVLGQKPPTGTNLSAAQRRVTGCRRVDEPTSIRKFRVAPRASCGPLDRRPAAGSLSLSRSGRIGCCGEPGRQPAARRLPRCALFLLHCGLLYFARSHSPISYLLPGPCRSEERSGVGRGALGCGDNPRSAIGDADADDADAACGGRRGARGKEAHRVRVQTRVRFQRRRFRSPIRARTREPESKEESDLLWTGDSESKEEPDLLWIREPESNGDSDLLWTGESDRVRVQGRVRSGKAFT
jgi:hypothetical protein